MRKRTSYITDLSMSIYVTVSYLQIGFTLGFVRLPIVKI